MSLPDCPHGIDLTAVNTESAKLSFLRDLDAHIIDVSMLPAQRRRFLAGLDRG
jgi:hypothetical protein